MIFIFILLSNIFFGCIEDDLVPITVEPVDPVVKVNAYALPESIEHAGNTTLYWESSYAASATANDISIPTNGSWPIEGLVSDTTFIFKFIGLNKEVKTDTVSIKVAEPTMYDTISSLYWVFQVSKGLVNGEWVFAYFDEDKRTRKWSYELNKKYQIFKQDGTRVGNGTYKIKQDTIILDNTNCSKFIISLVDSTMTIYNMNLTVITYYKGVPK
ncbi:TPA: hypothetical protein DIC38_01020 [Candidatus Nomurabacteria bacterium]|nr:hypothetical protein [Candidatus Nomurabacteria bacterium]